MPVTPQVSTAPSPLVLKELPNTVSIWVLRPSVASSRHRLTNAALSGAVLSLTIAEKGDKRDRSTHAGCCAVATATTA